MTVSQWLANQPDLRDSVAFETSGSTGKPKHVVLSQAALRASATMVNEHLQATRSDLWLGALPKHHVGGYSIETRAKLSGAGQVWLDGKWEPLAFREACSQHQATLTSLVPTQVYDLVSAHCQAPASLRAVLVGGGALSTRLHHDALALGWPILKTYGMTETASQVATQALGSAPDAPMLVLPGWETDLTTDGFLRLRGEALFAGYVEGTADGGFRFVARAPWFTTADRVALQSNTLTFLARDRDRVKIKGELVNLANLRADLESAARACNCEPTNSTLVAIDDSRDGQALALVAPAEDHALLLDALNKRIPAFLRPKRAIAVVALPRTPLGKLDEARLVALTGDHRRS